MVLSPVRFSFADAANLARTPDRAGQGKERDVDQPGPTARAASAVGDCRNREDESGLLEGTVSIVRREDATVKSTRERAEEKRAEKLDHVRQQVQTGSLVIGR